MLVLLFAECFDALSDAEIPGEVDDHHLSVEGHVFVRILFGVVCMRSEVHWEGQGEVFC